VRWLLYLLALRVLLTQIIITTARDVAVHILRGTAQANHHHPTTSTTMIDPHFFQPQTVAGGGGVWSIIIVINLLL